LDLVSQSEYLIGAFSTTLFEGLALGCKVLVLPLSGYQNVLPAIASGDLTLISSLEALPEYLAQAKTATDPFRYYSQI
jgi:spore coat polysaccharide biosynthesis predicted glycosyltransferase SpsG